MFRSTTPSPSFVASSPPGAAARDTNRTMERSRVRRRAVWVEILTAGAGVSFGLLGLWSARGPSEQTSSTSILEIFARRAFDWSNSTTPAPLSATAVLVKSILADPTTLPPGLDDAVVSILDHDSVESGQRVLDVSVSKVRDFLSSGILHEVQELCSSASGCDPNEVDPEFGITPLHMAQFWGSSELVEYLTYLGANHNAYDTVGRQPRNLSFPTFSKYSKMVGKGRLDEGAHPQDRCEIPEVVIPLPPGPASTIWVGETAAAGSSKEWQKSVQAALSEVRRLVSEGEPVMVRNVLPWLLTVDTVEGQTHHDVAPVKFLKYPDATSFVKTWAHRPVDVGSVPYAKKFNLANERKTLQDYYVAPEGAAANPATLLLSAVSGANTINNGGASADKLRHHAPRPNYVFQVDTEACVEGRELLGRIVDAALPSSGKRPLVCPPASGLRGLESVHYYLGRGGTGAPHHIHSDALNLVVTGLKKWWMLTPRMAVWSRRHVREYEEEGKGGPWKNIPHGTEARSDEEIEEEYRPMECLQRAGDLVYVPADWGHAAINLEDDTFG